MSERMFDGGAALRGARHLPTTTSAVPGSTGRQAVHGPHVGDPAGSCGPGLSAAPISRRLLSMSRLLCLRYLDGADAALDPLAATAYTLATFG